MVPVLERPVEEIIPVQFTSPLAFTLKTLLASLFATNMFQPSEWLLVTSAR